MSVRVPVDQRWLGLLDRRSVLYAVPALVVVVLWAWVLPRVDAGTGWDDLTGAGDVIQVTSSLTMAAQPGWGRIAGLKADEQTRSGQEAAVQDVLVKDGVSLVIQQGEFAGTTRELLDSIERIASSSGGEAGFAVKGAPIAMSTSGGLRGLAQGFTSTRNVGVVVAFVDAGSGIEVQVVGPPQQMIALSSEVYAMIDSLAATGQAPPR
jgi:hypothetical protein